MKKLHIFALILVACGRTSSPSPLGVPSASGSAASSVQTVASAQAAASEGGADRPSPVSDADADNAPMYSFLHAEARYWIDNESTRTPAG